MPSKFPHFIDLAHRLIDKYGKEDVKWVITDAVHVDDPVVSEADEMDWLTETVAPEAAEDDKAKKVTVSICFLPVTSSGEYFKSIVMEKSGSFTDETEIGFMAPQSFIPSMSDQIERDGEIDNIDMIAPIAPDGFPVVYIIRVK